MKPQFLEKRVFPLRQAPRLTKTDAGQALTLILQVIVQPPRMIVAALWAFIFCLALAGCSKPPRISVSPPDNLCEGDVILLRTTSLRGQAVLRADSDGRFTHAGIIHYQDAIPHLVHADPDSHVRMEPLTELFARTTVTACEALRAVDSSVASRAALWATGHAIHATPFDRHFRNSTPDALYCTEIVWRAFQVAGLDLLSDVAKPFTKLPLNTEPVLLPDAIARSAVLTHAAPMGLESALFESTSPKPAIFRIPIITPTKP